MKTGRITEEEKTIMFSMREDNKGYGEIAKVLNCSRDRVRNYCLKNGLGGFRAESFSFNTEESVEKTINSKYSKFEYIGGYTNADSYLYLICKDCGHTFKYNAQILKDSREVNIRCTECNKTENIIKQARRDLIKILAKIRNNSTREYNRQVKEELKIKEKQMIKKCFECDKKFITTKDSKYCSAKCMRRANDARKTLRRRKRAITNGDVDWSISLTKLIKKEKNVCHICGEKCDRNDYTINDNGAFIVKGKYPSIDHVQPIAKGGTHTWDNIKLAHCQCNSIKSDNLYYEDSNNQITMAI